MDLTGVLLHEDDDEVQQQTTTCQLTPRLHSTISILYFHSSLSQFVHTHHSVETSSGCSQAGSRSLHRKMMFKFHHHQQLLLLLLSSTSRQSLPPSLIKSLLPSSVLLNNKWYSRSKDDNGNDNHEIGEKARSTADEFARVAKEKGGFVSQSVDDAWEGTIEAVRETVEKDEHDVESVKNKHKKSAAVRAKGETEK